MTDNEMKIVHFQATAEILELLREAQQFAGADNEMLRHGRVSRSSVLRNAVTRGLGAMLAEYRGGAQNGAEAPESTGT